MSLCSRREFLAASVATGAALAFRSHGQAADAPAFGGFNVGAQSYSFRDFQLEPALKQYQTLGLKFGEFTNKHIPLESNPAQLEAVAKLCKEYGVTPIAYGVQSFSKKHDENRKNFELAKALGLKYLAPILRRTVSTVWTSSATNTRSPSAFTHTARLARTTSCTAGIQPKSSCRRSKITIR